MVNKKKEMNPLITYKKLLEDIKNSEYVIIRIFDSENLEATNGSIKNGFIYIKKDIARWSFNLKSKGDTLIDPNNVQKIQVNAQSNIDLTRYTIFTNDIYFDKITIDVAIDKSKPYFKNKSVPDVKIESIKELLNFENFCFFAYINIINKIFLSIEKLQPNKGSKVTFSLHSNEILPISIKGFEIKTDMEDNTLIKTNEAIDFMIDLVKKVCSKLEKNKLILNYGEDSSVNYSANLLV